MHSGQFMVYSIQHEVYIVPYTVYTVYSCMVHSCIVYSVHPNYVSMLGHSYFIVILTWDHSLAGHNSYTVQNSLVSLLMNG